ncbi:glycosyltransferase family 2 protein [Olleya namhaensis]|uniref:Glycosyltransferase involved in cell wall bisynthesis n=1 Tax=Olleya namhaensis TaxID=1144750 RepID=A0A1I3NII7_9FLAO|nr:glycosyltransferase [Olleya namhaensis]SFJ09178.1 Glycosyltransferase involved in cell wall bisynthesis [Olleya namhaensis]
MITNTPLITVLLPVYNVEKYIEEAIQSVLDQTFEDFEILVIDDCSTDNTLEIIETITDDRIKIIKKEANKGLIDSLNLGFSLAKGKYIARMDGDDVNELTRFEKQFNVLESNPDVIACGSWIKFFGSNEKLIKHRETHSEIVAQMLVKCPMSLGCCMLRTSAVKNIGFEDDKLHVEDYDFWTRIAWDGRLYNIQEVLYHYRGHDNQVSNKYKELQVRGDFIIQLTLFKKLNYCTNKFKDDLLSKFLLKSDTIELEEFVLFLNWIKQLRVLNTKSKVFNTIELDSIMNSIKKRVVYQIFFTNDFAGVTKKWRKKAIFKLSKDDIIYVLKLKSKERLKIISKLVKLNAPLIYFYLFEGL